MEFLNKIVARQRELVQQRTDFVSLQQLQQQAAQAKPAKGFARALWLAAPAGLICEMKQASPSAGVLRDDYDPAAIAKSYEKNGAACLSVLTNEFFHGTDEHLQEVRAAVDLPIIRKDFIISAYQVYESRVLGADAVLLIAACLDDAELQQLSQLALGLGLDVLLEVHTEPEATRALAVAKSIAAQVKPTLASVTKPNVEPGSAPAAAQNTETDNVPTAERGAMPTSEPGALLIGINNRNLHNFAVDLQAGAEILTYIREHSDYLLVGESGIKGAPDIARLQQAGAQAFLIGEALMREPDPGAALKKYHTAT